MDGFLLHITCVFKGVRFLKMQTGASDSYQNQRKGKENFNPLIFCCKAENAPFVVCIGRQILELWNVRDSGRDLGDHLIKPYPEEEMYDFRIIRGWWFGFWLNTSERKGQPPARWRNSTTAKMGHHWKIWRTRRGDIYLGESIYVTGIQHWSL